MKKVNLKKKIQGKYSVTFVPKIVLNYLAKHERFLSAEIADQDKVLGIRKGKYCVALVYKHVCKEYVLRAIHPLSLEAARIVMHVLINVEEHMKKVEELAKRKKMLGLEVITK